MKSSLDEFRQLLGKYDQQIIQPIIDEILANFEYDLNKFQTSEENWEKLPILKEKLAKNYEDLKVLIKKGSLQSASKQDEINSFFIQNTTNVDLLYQYKKIISDVCTKSSVLYEFKENKPDYKPVHFIFSFVYKAQKIEQLIAKYNLNIEDKADNSAPIHFAAQMNNEQGLELLLGKYKHEVNSLSGGNNRTPLHFAAPKGHNNIIKKLLLCPDIQINIQDNIGNTSLHLAINNGWPEVVETLLSANSDLNIINKNGNDPLHCAVILGYIESTKILFNHFYKQGRFINVDEFDDNGYTLLHYAVHHGDEQTVHFLVENYKANINLKTQNGIYSSYPLLIALAEKHYNIAKYLLEYGTLINYVEFSNNNLFAKTICFITQYYKVKFASSDESDNVNKSGIFNNSKNIIGFIKNWPKFDGFYRKYSANNFENNILEINEYKILEAQHLIKNIMQFFHNRQDGLHQLFLQGKLKNLTDDQADGNTNMHKMNKRSYKQKIDWQKLEDNLFYKYVLHNIMSGEIAFYNAKENFKISYNDRVNELGLFVRIFLIHKSRFINEKFQYQGELIDESKQNLSVVEQNIINNRPNKNNHKSDYDLYQMDLNNYQIIENWKNENFFKQILVSVYMNVISPESYLEKMQIALANLIAQNNNQKNAKEITRLKQVVENQDASGLIALPLEVWSLIASYLDIEDYLNPLKSNNIENPNHYDIPIAGQNSLSEIYPLDYNKKSQCLVS